MIVARKWNVNFILTPTVKLGLHMCTVPLPLQASCCTDGVRGAGVRRCSFSWSPKNGNVKSEPKYLACEESPICVLSSFELFLVPSLYWLLLWADFFAFIACESPAVVCVQHSFMHLALQIRMSRRASRAALPILHSQETSTQHRRVLHVSGIPSGCEYKLTFRG